MLNYLWAGMILIGVIYAAFTGNMSEVTNAALDSAGDAITLCITMAGVMALWMGLMEIGQQAGLIERLTRGISPFLNFMFPRIPRDHPAREYIATNIIANILGLGWACTPAGLKAMEELANLERERGNPQYLERGNSQYQEGEWGKPQYPEEQKGRHSRGMKASSGSRGRSASNEMCTFLIINISSLQLIPVNMIAYRSQYGSVNPAVIVAPSIVATLVSTVVAIGFCKIKDGGKK